MAIRPIRPATSVDILSAVNEKPAGRQNSAPQPACAIRVAVVQSVMRISPRSRSARTGSP